MKSIDIKKGLHGVWFVAIGLAILLLTPSILTAQVPSPGVGPRIQLIIEPENPAPRQSAEAKIQSFTTDLDRADISWFIDGDLVKRGTGVKNITFDTSPVGSKTDILVVARPVDGGTLQDQIVLRPVDLHLTFEADTYVPAFYKGKALPTVGANIRVNALSTFIGANGKKIDRENLIYTWRQDGNLLNSQSRFGKDSVLIKSPRLPGNATTIRLEATSLDQQLRGAASLVVQAVNPRLVLYENNPLLGIYYNSAVTNTLALEGEEIVVAAHPFFASAKKRSAPELVYAWTLNGEKITNPNEDKSSITFRITEAGEGSAQIGLSFEHTEKIFQQAMSSFTLLFDTTSDPFLF